MQIIVNGDTHEVRQDCTAAELVQALGLTGRRIAMEVNLEIVPRSTFAEHHLRAGDRVEIVHAIGGG
ncbi:MAG: thiamine biosynthesis protein ThiS [Gammaproteobacteria bacterium SG8_47]|nr:MAG: thiamine biosynthesis protein ThiS [Gammaproteobacteria bacterium SG8_47]